MASFNLVPTPLSAGAEAFDAPLDFDDSVLANDLSFPAAAYDFDHFTTFDDPFSYPTRPYDLLPSNHVHSHTQIPWLGAHHPPPATLSASNNPDSSSSSSPPTLDNKLLSFTAAPAPPSPSVLLNPDTDRVASPSITAELYGMFFVAEDVFTTDNPASGQLTATPRPLELTCYRRNLWQCSGQVTLPRCTKPFVLLNTETGQRAPVVELVASISAAESIDGKDAEIISIPWKSSGTDSTSGGTTAPPTIAIDPAAGGQEVDDRVSVAVSWKRLQFKHATANNGRRKGLQQHYVVRIALSARVKGEQGLVKVAEVRSSPVIVRGRSPRNFDGRGDVPVTVSGAEGGGKKERRGTEPSVPKAQQAWGASQQVLDWSTTPNPYPTPPATATTNLHPTKKLALSPSLPRPPVPAWDGSINSKSYLKSPSSASSTSNHGCNTLRPGAPISLSLSEDERTPPAATSRSSASTDGMLSPLGFTAHTSRAAGKGSGHGQGDPATALDLATDDDMLYEYFPLSLDDWMPPVDAVYRPHVVHHTIVPPEVKAQQARGRTKRYFAAE